MDATRHPSHSLPERVGPYRVHAALGSGGVGVVYEAEDEHLHRRVAVKVLLDASPLNAARFRREARAMGRLNHPNVATVFDVGEADGQPYIAMELVRGRTLRQWVAQRTTAVRRPSLADVLGVLRQASAGLQAAHDAGVVHRDFKPDNVLVGDDGRVRVVDFGLAKHHADLDDGRLQADVLARELVDARITRTGSLMGTPAYMAPEQFRGQGDARSDQFSLCVVLYEAIHGRLPFPGETAEALYEATSRGKLRAWPEHVDVPRPVRAVLRRGLAPKAEDRYPSMTALMDALDRAMAHDAVPRRRHKTRGMQSWRWRIAGAATGLVLAALGSMVEPPAPADASSDDAQRDALAHSSDDAEHDALASDDAEHDAATRPGDASDRAVHTHTLRSQAEPRRLRAAQS